MFEFSVLRMEAPVPLRRIEAPDLAWNAQLLASRETAERRAETVQMGYSLDRLLPELGVEKGGCPHPGHAVAGLRHLLTEPDHLALLLLPVAIAAAVSFLRRRRRARAKAR